MPFSSSLVGNHRGMRTITSVRNALASASLLALGVVLALAAGAAAQCSGGMMVGITLDASGSVSSSDFDSAQNQIASFVDSTSNHPKKINTNQYYVSQFSDSVTEITSGFETNDNQKVSDAVSNAPKISGGTATHLAIRDLQSAFEDKGVSSGIAIVVTDGGPNSPSSTEAAAKDLKDYGITVVALTIGVNPGAFFDFVSNDADGDPLIFSGDNFAEVEGLLVAAVETVDSDGDGVNDCDDGCPSDPNKTDPGECDCGNPDDDIDGDGVPDCKNPDKIITCLEAALPGCSGSGRTVEITAEYGDDN